VGVTDNLALSGGISIVPGLELQLAYFGPKVSSPISSPASLSTGLLFLDIPEDTEDAALGYAVGTSESFDQGFPFVPWVDFSVFFGK
jgi:hypothetical protein